MPSIASRSLAWPAFLALLTACASQPSGGNAPDTPGDDDAWRPESGAVDPDAFRAPGSQDRDTIFAELDLPTPTEARLASGSPGPAYWQQACNYTIRADFDADARRIHASATITYTNNSPHPLEHLWIHLEQNLFRRDSLGALSSEPDTRFGYTGFDGGFDIHAISGPGGDPLPLTIHDTIGRIDLPYPLAARGGTFALDIEWSFNAPPYGADRMGAEDLSQGTVFEFAQWFPAIATYDDLHGWNTNPYLGSGEFYTNFGDFDVTLTVPRSHIVVASGELQNPHDVLTPTQIERLAAARASHQTVPIRTPDEVADPASRPEGDGPLAWRFIGRDIRTFAWATSPAFAWDAAWATGCGPDGSGSLCQSVYPAEAVPLWQQSTEMLRSSIEHYSSRWYPYPYPIATNVNGIVGGMEYPMIIFCAERHDERGLFGVTTHEIGHNWFPMLVNTDERRHAWMDEGFDTFINHYAELERYGPSEENVLGWSLGEMAQDQQQPMATFPDQAWRGRLGFLAYGKPALMLILLREQVLGPDRFDHAFRTYIRRWAFKSPRPSDFFRCMEDASGADLDWFWRGWVFGTGHLDQAITAVDQGEERFLITFANVGEIVMPVHYLVEYTDGTRERRTLPVQAWFTTDEWTTVWASEGRTITRIVIDPDIAYPDLDRSNNEWAR